MVLVVVFGAALLVAVLLSGLAARSVLSTSLLFLLGGALVGDGALGPVQIRPDSPIVATTADLALVTVVFTGVHLSFPAPRRAWRNPVRALGLGMPLACAGMALVTHWPAGLDWTTSFLVGAVLAPTDPVFASSIGGRREAPARLRQLRHVLASLSPDSRAAFEPLGEAPAELSKFAALLVFGALLTPHLFGERSVGGYVAVVLAIVAVRPASLPVAPAGSGIGRREQVTAALVRPEGLRVGRPRPAGAPVGDPPGAAGVRAHRGVHRVLDRGAQRYGHARCPDVRRGGPGRHPRRRPDAPTCRARRRRRPAGRTRVAARDPNEGGRTCAHLNSPSPTRP